jgi:anti-sigma B factor antagonist
MKLSQSERYNSAIVSIRGEFFGLHDGPALVKALTELREKNIVRVVLDVTDTTRIDSSAIGAIIGQTEALRGAGGDLRFGGINERNRVLQLLTVLQLLDKYKWYPTVDEAAASYDEEAPGAPGVQR